MKSCRVFICKNCHHYFCSNTYRTINRGNDILEAEHCPVCDAMVEDKPLDSLSILQCGKCADKIIKYKKQHPDIKLISYKSLGSFHTQK